MSVSARPPEGNALLAVSGLTITHARRAGSVVLVNDIAFDVGPNERLGIVGESGCGKSMTALALMGLLPRPFVRASRGSIEFEGQDLLSLAPRVMRRIRGARIAMVFQDPMSSLNPVQTIGRQLVEAIRLHEPVDRSEARERARRLLDEVSIPAARQRLDDYPHQLSGGMRQRVMIAMALSCRPRLLIADEPTTALDVTIQAQILSLLRRLQAEREMAVILITHDFGVVAQFAERVLVMYGGSVVERAGVRELFDRPLHPYTRALMRSVPTMDTGTDELPVIDGMPPAPGRMPPGCPFEPRCDRRMPECGIALPPFSSPQTDRYVRCFAWSSPAPSPGEVSA
jgi:oligopeptide/dipeptide ABC transporter ATP-binding protein